MKGVISSQSHRVVVLFLPLLLVLLWSPPASFSTPVRRVVGVDLVASWEPTPLHLEAAEFFAEEGRFWLLVDSLHTEEASQHQDDHHHQHPPPHHDDDETEEALYTSVMKLANETFSQYESKLLHYALLLRYYSPQVEMFRQHARVARELAKHCPEGAWVHAGTHVLCSPQELQHYLEQSSREQGTAEEATTLFEELEHLYPNEAPGSALPLAVLYGQIGTSSFGAFHSLLREAATKSVVRYAVRHYTPAAPSGSQLNLQGYGVELAIKSTEYKVIDDKVPADEQSGEEKQTSPEQQEEEVEGFRFDVLKQRKPELASELDAFKEHLQLLSQQNEGLEQLRTWQLKDLGYQASQRVISAANPLGLLRDIAQNFPAVANSLSKLRLDADIRSDIDDNMESLRQERLGTNFIHFNGRNIDINSLDVFSLYEVLKEELSNLQSLRQFGIGHDDSAKLLSLVPVIPSPRFDLRDRHPLPTKSQPPEGTYVDPDNVNGVIQFANDLERDPKYAGLPGLNVLFHPTFPGQLHHIRKNIQTVVIVIDPSSQQGLELVKQFMFMLAQGLPFRIGFVFSSESKAFQNRSPMELSKLLNNSESNDETAEEKILENDATLIMRAYFYVKKHTDTLTALELFSHLSNTDPSENIQQRLWEAIKEVSDDSNSPFHADHSELVAALTTDAYDEEVHAMRQYIRQKGLSLLEKDSQYLFINGKFHFFPPGIPLMQKMQHLVMYESFYGYAPFQEALYAGRLQDDQESLWSWVLNKSKPLYSTFSALIFANNRDTSAQWISLAKHKDLLSPSITYISYPGTEFHLKEYTLLVTADLTTRVGLAQALEALIHLGGANKERVRLGFIHNTLSDPTRVEPNHRDHEFLIPRAFHAAFVSGKSPKRVYPFLVSLVAKALAVGPENVTVADIEELANVSQFANLPALMAQLTPQAYTLLVRDRGIASTMGLTSGEHAVCINGQVSPMQQNQVMSAQEIDLSEAHQAFVLVDQAKNALESVTEHHGIDPDDLSSEFFSNELATLVSMLASKRGDKSSIPALQSSFVVGKQEAPVLKLVAVVDPVSKAAQKIAPLLLSLVNHLGVQVDVVLTPTHLSELPLKSFYRYALRDSLTFDANGQLSQERGATFDNLPTSLLLTMNLDTPRSWVVQAVRAVYDLDNILLNDMGRDNVLSATFELKSILLEGHCPDKSNKGMPAVGLQINLGTPQEPHMTDTTVMANYGYFQLKASPGLWWLSLGKRLGDNENSKGYTLLTPNGIVPVPQLPARIHRFVSDASIFPVMRINDVEETLVHGGSFWENMMSFLQGKTDSSADDTIHVFSVASGHLYERFLKIMMLSVLKNTKSPVKFWFLENYLSPKFKEYAPLFSKAYNTSIEFVTYQWPSWLHHEHEKQRVIWGYKILFLDVLFPMNLHKIIYVDADQVVRADLRELYDMDLDGAPYGYTPFCNSRQEMSGFRFWDSGFWKNHLGHLPYHISALYVVDLKRFREMGAGDIIRASYQQLSRDKNSLSNLDQDLPNYLQSQVRIFSLPQEWLWCETWCDDESKSRAKTIDLCNNPLTKTPKLENAVRIVPEWRALDEEARAVEQQLKQHKEEERNATQMPLHMEKQILV